MRRYLRTAAAWCLALCLTLGMLPGAALAEEAEAPETLESTDVAGTPEDAAAGEASAELPEDTELGEVPAEAEEDAVLPEAGPVETEETESDADAADISEELPPIEEEPVEEELQIGYGEADLFQGGSFTGPQTMPGDPGVPLAAEAGEMTLYDAILAGIQAQDETINISAYNIPGTRTGTDVDGNPTYSSDAFDTFYQVVNDHPELFYVQTGFGYGYSGNEGDDTITIASISPLYNDELMGNDFQERFDAASEKALAQVNDEMTDLEKALVLHDYLVTNCRYDQSIGMGIGEEGPNIRSAYGALVNQNAVCQGYALAYKYLLDQVNIDAILVSSDQINHVWNGVKIGEKWYHVDVTWDDPVGDFPGRVHHNNFLRSEEGIIETGHCTVNDVQMEKDWVPADFVCRDTEYESGKYAFEKGNSGDDENEWSFYYDEDHNFYYIAHTSDNQYQVKHGALLDDEGETVVEQFTPFMNDTAGGGYFPDCFGVVWLDECLYYIDGGDNKLHCVSLLGDGEMVSDTTADFTPVANSNRFPDYLGLRYNGEKLQAVSTADARRPIVAEFDPLVIEEPPAYPPEWDSYEKGICGLTEDGTLAGIMWDKEQDADFYVVIYSEDDKMLSLEAWNGGLKEGVTLVDVTPPDDGEILRLFLVSADDNMQPLCASWREEETAA